MPEQPDGFGVRATRVGLLRHVIFSFYCSDVRATGDARVGFIGFPSVGKSTLLTQLTGALLALLALLGLFAFFVCGLKHTLLTHLQRNCNATATGVESEAADYEFTTLTCIPGCTRP